MCFDFIHQNWITVMGSTWAGFLKPLRLGLVQYTAAFSVSGVSYKKKNGSTVFLDVSLKLSSSYKLPWPSTAFVDVKGSVSVTFSAVESNLKCY